MTTRPLLGLMYQFGGDRAYRPETFEKRFSDLRAVGGYRVLLNRFAGQSENEPIVIANQSAILRATNTDHLYAMIMIQSLYSVYDIDFAEYAGIAVSDGTQFGGNVLLDPNEHADRIVFHSEVAFAKRYLNCSTRFIDFTGDNVTEQKALDKYRLPDTDLNAPRLDRFKQFADEVAPWGVVCGNEMPKRNPDGTLDREWAMTRPQIATDTGYRVNNGDEWMRSALEIGADLRMMCTTSTTDEQFRMAFECGVTCYVLERDIERVAVIHDEVSG